MLVTVLLLVIIALVAVMLQMFSKVVTKVSVVYSYVSVMNEEYDNLNTTVRKIHGTVETIDNKIDEISNALGVMGDNNNSRGQRLDKVLHILNEENKLDTKINVISNTLNEIKLNLASVCKQSEWLYNDRKELKSRKPKQKTTKKKEKLAVTAEGVTYQQEK